MCVIAKEFTGIPKDAGKSIVEKSHMQMGRADEKASKRLPYGQCVTWQGMTEFKHPRLILMEKRMMWTRRCTSDLSVTT